MAIADRVREVVGPLADTAGVEVYDVEHHGAVVRVLIDAPGGVDIDTVARFSRSVSRALDAADPIASRYTLEVSSPGLERPLRTPEHFRGAVGERVKIKTHPHFDGPRRIAGTLQDAAEEWISVRDEGETTWRIAYVDVSSARTVFAWGAPQRGSKRPVGGRNADTRQQP